MFPAKIDIKTCALPTAISAQRTVAGFPFSALRFLNRKIAQKSAFIAAIDAAFPFRQSANDGGNVPDL